MHVISLGMIVPAIRILAILSPTMPPLPSTPIPSPPHSQREQISRPTVLFEVALSKLAQPQTYRVKLCSEATRLCREYAHIHVIQARVLSRPTLVPAVIGYGGREEAFRGASFSEKWPQCTIVTRLDARMKKEIIRLHFLRCLVGPPTARKRATRSLSSAFSRRLHARQWQETVVALTCTFMRDRLENKSRGDYFSLRHFSLPSLSLWIF